jgi:hypothetical protein
MKNLLVSIFCLLAGHVLMAQASAEAVNEKDILLRERFSIMKAKSQTYGEYKVIREYVLDGVWKITQDSIRKGKSQLAEANSTIAALKKEIDAVNSKMKQKDESVAGVVHDSTHISVLGIDIDKKAFLSFVGILIAGLLLLLGLVSGKLKLMYSSMKEKVESLNIVNKEYDEFKHKALEKQIKLSRELQNERNKLQELRSH